MWKFVEVDTEADGAQRCIYATAVAVAYPDCATPTSLAKQRLACRLRDMPHGLRRIRVVWFKLR